MPLATSCTNEQKRIVLTNPKTQGGQPATIDGALTVEVVSGDGTFEVDPALPTQFKAVSGTALGDTVYNISADADLGAGVQTITDQVTLTVTSASAASFGLAEGAVEQK